MEVIRNASTASISASGAADEHQDASRPAMACRLNARDHLRDTRHQQVGAEEDGRDGLRIASAGTPQPARRVRRPGLRRPRPTSTGAATGSVERGLSMREVSIRAFGSPRITLRVANRVIGAAELRPALVSPTAAPYISASVPVTGQRTGSMIRK